MLHAAAGRAIAVASGKLKFDQKTKNNNKKKQICLQQNQNKTPPTAECDWLDMAADCRFCLTLAASATATRMTQWGATATINNS